MGSGALEAKGRRVNGFLSEIRNQADMICSTRQEEFVAEI